LRSHEKQKPRQDKKAMMNEPNLSAEKMPPSALLTISIVWYIDDVQSVRPDLSDEQAWEVLLAAKDNHDASLGINWDVLESWCDNLYPLEEDYPV
jgi:hypothetical protein